MIDRTHPLPITKHCRVLQFSRSSYYSKAKLFSEEKFVVMHALDRLHLEFPFAGSRMLRDLLAQQGHVLGSRQIRSIMRKMGIEALYRKPNTSKKHVQHTVYPYLLQGLAVERPNQVWATDITYIPMRRGFVYLVAVID